jgi:hypothetical protein
MVAPCACARAATDRWTSSGIGRQSEQARRALQALPPIGDVALQNLPLQRLPLPEGKIAVLDRQLRQG